MSWIHETHCSALFRVVDETLGLNIESNSSDDDVMMNCSYMYKDSITWGIDLLDVHFRTVQPMNAINREYFVSKILQ